MSDYFDESRRLNRWSGHYRRHRGQKPNPWLEDKPADDLPDDPEPSAAEIAEIERRKAEMHAIKSGKKNPG
jgi:hypothetical protein